MIKHYLNLRIILNNKKVITKEKRPGVGILEGKRPAGYPASLATHPILLGSYRLVREPVSKAKSTALDR